MAPKPCLDCSTPTTKGSRCTTCQKAWDRARNHRRPWYQDPAYKQARAALKAGDTHCHRCGTHLPPGQGTTDHVPPVAQATDWRSCQLLPACSACNSANAPL